MTARAHIVAAALVDAWNAHDVEQVVALHATDFEGRDVALPAPLRGPNDVRRTTRQYLQAFPDLVLSVESLSAHSHEAVLAWQVCGTHLGPLMHIPPTHRQIEVCGISLLGIARGRIQRSHTVWDVAGLLRGLGLLPRLSIDTE